MSTVDVTELDVNGVKYVRADSVKQRDGHSNSPIKIVVLQRGWVAVGRYAKDGDYIRLTNVSIIRRWGAQAKSLGGLVDGPLSDTVLDNAGDIEFHELTQIFAMNVSESAWASKL